MLNETFTSVRKLLVVGLLFLSSMSFGQSPFDGIVIEEVPINPTALQEIEDLNLFSTPPRCWRVYACMNAPNWEVQAVSSLYDGNTGILNPWIVECPACPDVTHFYQSSPFGGVLGDEVPPAAYVFLPSAEYDSWFFIGEPQFLPNPSANVTFISANPLDPSIAFEAGGDFIETSFLNSAMYGEPSPNGSGQGTADGQSRVLIAQLTTNGVFNGILSMQFRRLNPDYTLFLPPTTIIEYDVAFTNFPGSFDETCPQVFLPVELIEFNAAPSDDRVNVLWKTASERNAENFTVEHSLDLESWSDIGTLPAAGNSDQEETYFLAHKEPSVGVNYYRLRQKDHNGALHHSDARSAVFKASEITFYPNPASDRVWFKGDLSQVSVINVYDMHGRLVIQQTGNQDVIREMDINSLEQGAYIVEFIYPDGTSFRDKLQVNG